MKNLIAAVALVGMTGCGTGVSPELYSVIVDFFRAGTGCYTNGVQPNSAVTASSATAAQFEVYDGADQKAFLEVVEGGRQVDMGDAPDMQLTGLLEGTRGTSGEFAFTMNRTLESTQTVLGQVITTTDTMKATATFARGPTFKGTLSLQSSRACTGTGCTSATCSIDGVPIRGTRLAVEYQRAP